MKKYSKEQLSGDIASLISFEDGLTFAIDNALIEYEGCIACVIGAAWALEDVHGNTNISEVYISHIDLQFADDSETIFYTDELNEIEKLVKLYS